VARPDRHAGKNRGESEQRQAREEQDAHQRRAQAAGQPPRG
jgi:hypothetical protein